MTASSEARREPSERLRHSLPTLRIRDQFKEFDRGLPIDQVIPREWNVQRDDVLFWCHGGHAGKLRVLSVIRCQDRNLSVTVQKLA